ncbi:hypothetical protein BC332_21459 [Capsicum chinense]|nr:hypothetical protein BC332_21459 [Capsicum chinense]
MGSVGARELTVLGEFKPFGLIAEALDGKPSDTCVDDYRYFLFSPHVTKQTDEADEHDLPSPSSDRSDHELFIRGNRIIWSIGLRVYKRFTLPSAVIKACWCQMGDTSDTVLCILQWDSLSIYDTSGEVTSVPLPRSITSIWPLPFGLLLQQAPEGSSQAHIQFSSLSPLLNARDTIRSKREVSTQQNYTAVLGLDFTLKGDGSSMSSHLILKDPLEEPQNCTAVLGLDFTLKGDGSSMSSHLILKDPLEEPQPTYIEEKGRLNLNKEFDERTIWTGDCVPLMASYNKAKLQHSLWVVETINSNIEMGNSRFPGVPLGVLMKQFSFRRIWQGKGSQEAATKVFLATDDYASPIICFLLQEQNKLLSLQLHTVEKNTKVIYDIKPDMSWSIPAVAAAPVVVTRPGVKVCGLPFVDIVVLTSKNTLLLYGFVIGNHLGVEKQLCHLLYADDTVIFSEDKEEHIKNIRILLVVFEAVSGLVVNWKKSSIFFENEVPQMQRLANILGCCIENFPTVYLGMPLGNKHKELVIWDGIIEKAERKLARWKAQYLSLGGRTTLINSVLDSLPTNVMSLFPLPAKVEERLDKLRRDFLWSGNKEGKGTHLVKWRTTQLSKSNRGLGIRNLRLQNNCLLTKWLWRFGNEE